MKTGIDISRYQLDVDWDAIPDDIGFVVIRASIGNYYTDPRFTDYFDAVCAKQLVTGAYHVLIADNTVESQLDRLELALNGRKPDMLVLDCELPGTVSSNIRKRRTYWMMRKLDERWPTPVKLYYTNANYWNNQIGATYSGYEFKDFLLWVASYGSKDKSAGTIPDTDEYPAIPDAWKDAIPQWWIWQYDSRGTVPGFEGNVDLDGMREDFFVKLDAKKECAGEPEPPEPPPDELEPRVAALEDWAKSYPRES